MTDSKHHIADGGNSLRDRIAAVIMESCHGVYLDDAVDAADAVIRELEASYVLVPKNVTLVQWADEAFRGQPEGKFKREHITEWTADE